MAGADRSEDITQITTNLQEKHLSTFHVVSDTEIALQAGSATGKGIVIVCGTAVNAFAVDSFHELHYLGGHGYAFGDYGGGLELSTEVFRTVIRAWDKREKPTLLTALVLEQLGYDSVEAMYEACIRYPKTVPKDLAPLLFIAEEQGDEAASQILNWQADEFVKTVGVLIDAGEYRPPDQQIILAGSLLTKSSTKALRRLIREKLVKEGIDFRVVPLVDEPVSGAVQMAMNYKPMK
ncbi:N-acetylglucosamine kinase [Geomicrobium sp. JCM 19037]|nr:N-acetylglucosamine kinase [Geomicrobium sp. JCM 19037]